MFWKVWDNFRSDLSPCPYGSCTQPSVLSIIPSNVINIFQVWFLSCHDGYKWLYLRQTCFTLCSFGHICTMELRDERTRIKHKDAATSSACLQVNFTEEQSLAIYLGLLIVSWLFIEQSTEKSLCVLELLVEIEKPCYPVADGGHCFSVRVAHLTHPEYCPWCCR